jgi:hypothetical protein
LKRNKNEEVKGTMEQKAAKEYKNQQMRKQKERKGSGENVMVENQFRRL